MGKTSDSSQRGHRTVVAGKGEEKGLVGGQQRGVRTTGASLQEDCVMDLMRRVTEGKCWKGPGWDQRDCHNS